MQPPPPRYTLFPYTTLFRNKMKGETMSQSINENGELIKIANYSSSELNKLKRKKYYCIDCNKRLILKVGNRNRPHFTHMSESNEKKYYGESDHHKLAINKIYKSFKIEKAHV